MRLEPGLIALTLRADGSAPLTLAQVQVDGAWRAFTLTPDAPIGRLGTARLDIPYPWVEGETHHLLLLTATGVGFEHTIDVALATPAFAAQTLGMLTLVGLLLGVAPVAIGLLAFPAMRRAGPGALRFLLALTVGLLVYLMIDTLGEGLELGAAALGRLRGETLVWVAALFTAALLLGLGRAAAWRRAAWRSPGSSRSASGCTTSARAWSSARRSPPARRRWRRSWWWASSSTT